MRVRDKIPDLDSVLRGVVLKVKVQGFLTELLFMVEWFFLVVIGDTF